MEPITTWPFRILDENIIEFSDDKQLSVIITKEHAKYGIEVVTEKIGLGRRYSPNKDIAIEIFNLIYEKLSKFREIRKAAKFVSFLFEAPTFQILNALRMEKEKVAIVGVNQLKLQFPEATLVKKVNMEGSIRKPGSVTYDAILGERKLGSFVGKNFSDKFRFELA